MSMTESQIVAITLAIALLLPIIIAVSLLESVTAALALGATVAIVTVNMGILSYLLTVATDVRDIQQ